MRYSGQFQLDRSAAELVRMEAVVPVLFYGKPGDLVQLSFNGQEFQHTPVVVRVTAPITLETVLIAAHSYDADNRPLSTYTFQDIRFLHVLGTIRP